MPLGGFQRNVSHDLAWLVAFKKGKIVIKKNKLTDTCFSTWKSADMFGNFAQYIKY